MADSTSPLACARGTTGLTDKQLPESSAPDAMQSPTTNQRWTIASQLSLSVRQSTDSSDTLRNTQVLFGLIGTADFFARQRGLQQRTGRMH